MCSLVRLCVCWAAYWAAIVAREVWHGPAPHHHEDPGRPDTPPCGGVPPECLLWWALSETTWQKSESHSHTNFTHLASHNICAVHVPKSHSRLRTSFCLSLKLEQFWQKKYFITMKVLKIFPVVLESKKSNFIACAVVVIYSVHSPVYITGTSCCQVC